MSVDYEKSVLILNSKNVSNNYSNKIIYRFPSNTKFDYGDTIALQCFNMYNFVYNVSSENNNNKLKIHWIDETEYLFTISDGFYTIDQLNYALQAFCALNNLYLLDSQGGIIYFFEMVIDSIRYGSLLRCFKVPKQTNATILNYTKPTGATWNFPTNDKTGKFEILNNNNFGSLIGFESGIYPNTYQTDDQTFLSSFTPQIAVVNSIILCCNLINTSMAIPSNVLSSIPINKGFGQMLINEFDNPTPINICPNTYSTLEITLFDQTADKTINILDKELLVRIVISKKK